MSDTAVAVHPEQIDGETGAVHAWRVRRLTGLGLTVCRFTGW